MGTSMLLEFSKHLSVQACYKFSEICAKYMGAQFVHNLRTACMRQIFNGFPIFFAFPRESRLWGVQCLWDFQKHVLIQACYKISEIGAKFMGSQFAHNMCAKIFNGVQHFFPILKTFSCENRLWGVQCFWNFQKNISGQASDKFSEICAKCSNDREIVSRVFIDFFTFLCINRSWGLQCFWSFQNIFQSRHATNFQKFAPNIYADVNSDDKKKKTKFPFLKKLCKNVSLWFQC
jgi:hypothetical protein